MQDTLRKPGYFEEAPDVNGAFRVVTTHHYPWGQLMGWLRIKPLTEKWEEGTLDELMKEAARLKSSTGGPVSHPVQLRFVEEMAQWEREQGQTLENAVQSIEAELEQKRRADLYPMKSLGDPVI